MRTINYKGFIGSVETNLEDMCLFGKLLYINDLVTYEAQTLRDLEKEFKESVNEHIKTCKKLSKDPTKP